ncbi:tetratricopeptide repeat protein [Alkaliphilus hydrothermalis]|uniref:Tetratricopeptide (TPR) repeat protein n=1 Tax=Alkaliphilus hydrothermalis TaxID=1482730 RepID=A0ABS2NSH1_9FIRM|nr:tetratricopeptide repeat protein [Alkaliphilus hydrothermalis]MBM7615786.1 tetratricopeptide (TPR) repeat protein [Alkaliphilus hydrothermalis]
MKLNIFFSNNEERLRFIKAQLKGDKIVVEENKMVSPVLQGISSVKFKTTIKGVPGYWLELQFDKSSKGKEVYNKLLGKMDKNTIEENVFYPREALGYRELESKWNKKYNLLAEEYNEDSWGLFYKELRTHLRDKRGEVTFYGLMIYLKYNPFYLKRYKRFYIFEELAYHFEEEGNLGKAIKCLKLHQKLQPDSVEPYLNMTSFYIINEMEDEAITLCKEALKKYPDNKYLISNLVLALSNIGNHDYAVEFIKKTIKKQSGNPYYWKMMGDLLYEMEKNTEAIDCYQKALSQTKEKKNDEFTTDLYHGIASAYYEVEEFEDAVRYYEKVLSHYPADGFVLLSLSQIYLYNLKDLKLALEYGEMLLEKVPENGYGQYQVGLIYLQMEQYEKAKWHLYKARRMLPNYEPVTEAIQYLKQLKRPLQINNLV